MFIWIIDQVSSKYFQIQLDYQLSLKSNQHFANLIQLGLVLKDSIQVHGANHHENKHRQKQA